MGKKSVCFLSSFLLMGSLIPQCIDAGILDWFSPALSQRAQKAKDSLEGFDLVLEKALVDYQVPGLAIGVVVDGQLVYSKGFGVRDIEKKQPVTTDTLFGIGSCTKGFTAFLAGTFVDEGAMSWDELVIDLLPEFRLYDQYATQHLTVRDLLTHRSGMPRHDYMWYNGNITRADLMKRLRYLEPACEIRDRYHYNNVMYMTAGYAMEKLTGKSWETLVAERILLPLEMKNTNFSIADMKKSADFASPHMEKNDQLKKIGMRDFQAIGPAASINSSVNDLVHWVQMQLNKGMYEGKALVSQATLQEMHSPQVVVSGTPEHKEAFLSTYGIGWGVISYRGNYLVSHDGGLDGYTSVISLLPNEGVGVVILANKNLTTLPRFLSLETIDRVLGLHSLDWCSEGVEVYKKSKESQKALQMNEDLTRKKNTHPSHSLEEYVGIYEHPGYGSVEIQLVDGKLVSTFNSISSALDHWHYDIFVVSQESEDLFFSRQGTKLTFHTNGNGELEELTIPFEPGTSDIVFKKLAQNRFGSTGYLNQFVGLYENEAYGVTIEIRVREQSLIAIIPGQPIYELLPSAENEFSVKSKTGFNVRFVIGSGQTIEEVSLIHPFGVVGAKPKKLAP